MLFVNSLQAQFCAMKTSVEYLSNIVVRYSMRSSLLFELHTKLDSHGGSAQSHFLHNFIGKERAQKLQLLLQSFAVAKM